MCSLLPQALSRQRSGHTSYTKFRTDPTPGTGPRIGTTGDYPAAQTVATSAKWSTSKTTRNAGRAFVTRQATTGAGPNAPSAALLRTLQAATRKPIEAPAFGQSPKVVIPRGSELTYSLQAEATLTWARSGREVSVHFDPTRRIKPSAISIGDGPLTITDPGHLQHAAKRYEKAIQDRVVRELHDALARAAGVANPVSHQVSTMTTHPIVPPGRPLPTVELNVAATTVHAPLHNVNIATSFAVGDKISASVTATTGFSVRVAGYGEIQCDYSITAEADARPNRKPRSRTFDYVWVLPLAAALAALIVGTGYVLGRPETFP